jgi:hypothetical protein
MALSKAKYNPFNPPLPKLISLGISLITHEKHHLIQDDRHIEIPVDDAVTYITIDRNIIEIPQSHCINYKIVADILDTEGYPKRLWRIMHCWECLPDPITNEIF